MKDETPKREKILLPCDGSERCLKTIKYVSKLLPFRKYHIVLFHVFRSVPKSYWDLERNPKDRGSKVFARAWEKHHREEIAAKLEKAKGIFQRAGFERQAVSSIIRDRKQGVARDIIIEARTGYHAVVIRRRGRGAIRGGATIGSVATKLIEHLTFMPVLIIGTMPPAAKVLLAMDHSKHSLRAVEFAASMLGDLDVEARMVHVIRGVSDTSWYEKKSGQPPRLLVAAEKEIQAVFERAKGLLLEAGFKENNISSTVLLGPQSRAKAIAEEAKKGGYSTIVMGRVGLSNVKDFFIGRVTNKTIQIARQHSVWVVT